MSDSAIPAGFGSYASAPRRGVAGCFAALSLVNLVWALGTDEGGVRISRLAFSLTWGVAAAVYYRGVTTTVIDGRGVQVLTWRWRRAPWDQIAEVRAGRWDDEVHLRLDDGRLVALRNVPVATGPALRAHLDAVRAG